MRLRDAMRQLIVRDLRRDYEETLLGDFDETRRADTFHHARRLAYGAACGVFGHLEDSPIQGDEDVWQRVLRMFDIVCDWQREDGLWDCTPVNIYDPPMRLPIEKAVCHVSANLHDGPVKITLRLEDTSQA